MHTGAQIHEDLNGFDSDILWIQEQVRRDYLSLPTAVGEVAHYYLTRRIKVLPEAKPCQPQHPLVVRPMPYIAFWVSHDFGIANAEIRRLLGLSLVYSAISGSPRDDILDGLAFAPREQRFLEEWFWGKYFLVFKQLFTARSRIWHVLMDCTAEWGKGDQWHLFPDRDVGADDPLSEHFLRETSRYLVALVFPTLAGAAFLSKQAKNLASIRRLVEYCCMSFRIVDDMRDWREDLQNARHNHSSVLYYLKTRLAGMPITIESAVSLLSEETILSHIFARLEKLYVKAKREAENLHAEYVLRYLDRQLIGQEAELKRILAAKQSFGESIASLIDQDNRQS
jgi:hypothetical protein